MVNYTRFHLCWTGLRRLFSKNRSTVASSGENLMKTLSGGRLLQHTAVCLQLNIHACWLQRRHYQFNHHPQDKPERENNPIQSRQKTGSSSPSASLSDDGKYNWSRGRQRMGGDQKAITKSCSDEMRQTMRVIIWILSGFLVAADNGLWFRLENLGAWREVWVVLP